MKILIAEDNIDLNNSLTKRLTLKKHIIDQAFDGVMAIDFLEYTNYDLVILDIMMPKLNGYDVLIKMRDLKISTPVIFLTAKDSDNDIIKGLNLGADDYITKPFSYDVLESRINALIRRSVNQNINIYSYKDIKIDIDKMIVYDKDNLINLSNKEYELLLLLIKNKEKVITRDLILDNIYDINKDILSNVIDCHIKNLRKKLIYSGSYIKTIRGIGYKLED